MDLDPFVAVGIEASTMRFLDIFLLHCLLGESALDTPDEIAALARNQQAVAARGREPGLLLERGGTKVALADWARELLEQCAPVAAALDATHGGNAFAEALAEARGVVDDGERAPSARVLATMRKDFEGSYTRFTRAQSVQTRNHLLALPFGPELMARFAREAEASVAEQRRIEAADSVPFEEFRQAYLSTDRLRL